MENFYERYRKGESRVGDLKRIFRAISGKELTDDEINVILEGEFRGSRNFMEFLKNRKFEEIKEKILYFKRLP